MRIQGTSALLMVRVAVPIFLSAASFVAAQLPESRGDQEALPLTVAAETSTALPSSTDSIDPMPAAPATKTRIQSALHTFEYLLQEHRKQGNRRAEADTLAAIASAYRVLKEEQRAVEYFQSELQIWRDLGDREHEATTIAHIGDVYREWGFPQQALPFYRDALELYPQTSDREGQAAMFNNIGVVYLTLSNKRKSLDSLSHALAAYQANHNARGEAVTLSNIGAVYIYLAKDSHKALETFQQAVASLTRLNDAAGEANALDMVGVAALTLNRKEIAGLSLQRALILHHDAGDIQGEAAASEYLRQLSEPGRFRTRRILVTASAAPDPIHLTAAQLQLSFEIAPAE